MSVSGSEGVSGGMDRRSAIKRVALMLGAAVSASTIAGALAAERIALGMGASWEPRFLTLGQGRLVSIAAELILPQSDTPGAQDVGVPQLIDLMYGKYMSEAEKERFDAGLLEMESAGFLEKSPAEQREWMGSVSEASRAFMRHLREMTITGYFTSEEVVKTVLRFDPIPGAYHGCVPISETGNVNRSM